MRAVGRRARERQPAPARHRAGDPGGQLHAGDLPRARPGIPGAQQVGLPPRRRHHHLRRADRRGRNPDVPVEAAHHQRGEGVLRHPGRQQSRAPGAAVRLPGGHQLHRAPVAGPVPLPGRRGRSPDAQRPPCRRHGRRAGARRAGRTRARRSEFARDGQRPRARRFPATARRAASSPRSSTACAPSSGTPSPTSIPAAARSARTGGTTWTKRSKPCPRSGGSHASS